MGGVRQAEEVWGELGKQRRYGGGVRQAEEVWGS